MTCPEKDCFMCKMETEYNLNADTVENYRPRPQYRDSTRAKLWMINIAIIIVFALFMYTMIRKK